jgi:hypothetical protein
LFTLVCKHLFSCPRNGQSVVSCGMENSIAIETCARAAYEVNRAYCIALGDMSFGPWDDAPDWQKNSNREGVALALAGATPAQSHESWLAEKIRSGWKYGPIKNADTKEHPCMVPYDDLPPNQRRKDELYLTVVRAMNRALKSD